jgi:NAD(P)-dependent dehydrogenase (short-subunit alcohol dehydrogenase family)
VIDVEPTALVTGSTSGLGYEVSRRLLEAGWRVVVHGRDRARVEALAEEFGGAAVPVVADLASLAEVRMLAERVSELAPRLSALVNNAAVGFGAPDGPRQVSVDGHELRFAVNYLAPVLLSRLLLPSLVAAAPARIVNVGSGGQMPFDPQDAAFVEGYNGIVAYRRSKLALATFTFELAGTLRETGVTVNCLHPASFMPTAMVLESKVEPWSTLEDGVRPTLRLITDPALAEVTGGYFDGDVKSRARPEAYDTRFRRSLREVTDQLLSAFTTAAPNGMSQRSWT